MIFVQAAALLHGTGYPAAHGQHYDTGGNRSALDPAQALEPKPH